MKSFPLLLAGLLAAVVTGCGSGGAVLPQPDRELSLDAALAQVAGVNVATLTETQNQQLRDAFSQALLATGKTRFTSAVPSEGVDDLSVTDNGDGTVTFRWTYRNTGDLDQNSQVNISDLSALGANLGARSTDAGWPAAQVADGDGNGEVNISDVTSIGANFMGLIDGYRLEVSLDGAVWNPAVDVPFADSQLPPGGGPRYFEYVLAAPQDGATYRVSGSDGVATGAGSNTVAYHEPPPSGQVQNRTASQDTLAQAVQLDWDTFAGATHYSIAVSDAIDGNYVELGQSAPGATTFTDNPVTPGTHYWYSVTALDGSGAISLPSAPAEGWAISMPATPGNLVASDGAFSDKVALGWDAAQDATSYNVSRADVPGGPYTFVDTTAGIAYDDTGVVPGVTYYYVVEAVNDAGAGPQSNEDAGFASAAPPPPPDVTDVTPAGGMSGMDAQFSATIGGGPGPYTYSWDFGGGAVPNTSSAESPTVTLGAPGTYGASLHVDNDGGGDTYAFALSVDPPGGALCDLISVPAKPGPFDNFLQILCDDPMLRRNPGVIIDVINLTVDPVDSVAFSDVLKLSGMEFPVTVTSSEVYPRLTILAGNDPSAIDAATAGEPGIIVVERNPGKISVDIAALPDPSPGDQDYVYKLFDENDQELGDGSFTLLGLPSGPLAPTGVDWGVNAFDREDIPLADRHYDVRVVQGSTVDTPTPDVLWFEFSDGFVFDPDSANNVRAIFRDDSATLADYTVRLDLRVAGLGAGGDEYIFVHPLNRFDFDGQGGPGNLAAGFTYTVMLDDPTYPGFGEYTYADKLLVGSNPP